MNIQKCDYFNSFRNPVAYGTTLAITTTALLTIGLIGLLASKDGAFRSIVQWGTKTHTALIIIGNVTLIGTLCLIWKYKKFLSLSVSDSQVSSNHGLGRNSPIPSSIGAASFLTVQPNSMQISPVVASVIHKTSPSKDATPRQNIPSSFHLSFAITSPDHVSHLEPTAVVREFMPRIVPQPSQPTSMSPWLDPSLGPAATTFNELRNIEKIWQIIIEYEDRLFVFHPPERATRARPPSYDVDQRTETPCPPPVRWTSKDLLDVMRLVNPVLIDFLEVRGIENKPDFIMAIRDLRNCKFIAFSCKITEPSMQQLLLEISPNFKHICLGEQGDAGTIAASRINDTYTIKKLTPTFFPDNTIASIVKILEPFQALDIRYVPPIPNLHPLLELPNLTNLTVNFLQWKNLNILRDNHSIQTLIICFHSMQGKDRDSFVHLNKFTRLQSLTMMVSGICNSSDIFQLPENLPSVTSFEICTELPTHSDFLFIGNAKVFPNLQKFRLLNTARHLPEAIVSYRNRYGKFGDNGWRPNEVSAFSKEKIISIFQNFKYLTEVNIRLSNLSLEIVKSILLNLQPLQKLDIQTLNPEILSALELRSHLRTTIEKIKEIEEFKKGESEYFHCTKYFENQK